VKNKAIGQHWVHGSAERSNPGVHTNGGSVSRNGREMTRGNFCNVEIAFSERRGKKKEIPQNHSTYAPYWQGAADVANPEGTICPGNERSVL